MEEIYDPLRRKNVRRTPEEEVRQAAIRYLEENLGVPRQLMVSEHAFTFNSLQYRADILVYDRELRPLLLVECKAPSVHLDEAILEQVLRYNRVLQVRYILLTNGKSSYFCAWDDASGSYRFAESVPTYEQMLQQ
ncbi:MAG: type I restriction enzyme HsdR N-terminal domain-containing protein [Bacteroidales bacterium]|nr:type I restriction enzyme HsdR N-terminal domain-containing protein [Bacteroidales bacterium]